MNWYSLRVMSGRENKVKDSIFRELDFEKDLKPNVEEILIPTENIVDIKNGKKTCLLYTSPSPRDLSTSRMPSSA